MTPLSFIKVHFTGMPQKGFTLVELIVTIVLVGLIGVFTTLFVYTGLNGYLRAKDTSEGALNAQITLDRISMELRDIEKINTFSGSPPIQMSYDSRTLGENRQIRFSGDIISIDDGTGPRDLLGGVTNFAMTLTAADLNNSAGGKEEVQAVNVSFNVGDIERLFSASIFPRNMVKEP
jgi:prepilin-type N-terminal cleavage/methylation domain-containing protein